MPRPLRVHITGALYHVTSCAPSGEQLFRDKEDYAVYVDLLRFYREQFGFKLFAYVLLPNRLHLAVELNERVTLSTIMHALNTRYTKYYSKRYGTKGHVFQSRFKTSILEKEQFLLSVTGYIHSLPQRVGLAKPELIYPWCSYPRYLVVAQDSRLGIALSEEVDEVLEAQANQSPGWSYDQYIHSTAEGVWEQMEATLQQHIAGSEEFVASVQQRIKSRSRMRRQLGPAQPAPQPGPQPHARLLSMPSWKPSVAVASSIGLIFVALGVAGINHRNVSTLKQTVKVLEQERAIPRTVVVEIERSLSATARPVSLVRPSNLNGTTWDLRLIAASGTDASLIKQDLLRFEGQKVFSSRLSTNGFRGAQYKLELLDDHTFTWKAVQTGPDNQQVSWLGECDGRIISGVMRLEKEGRVISELKFMGMPRKEMKYAGSSKETLL